MGDIEIAEIKARCCDQDRVREALLAQGADYKGTDSQADIYFNCSHGRLKLRKGNIENNLIHYEREERKGTKRSTVKLYKTQPSSPLEGVLTAALGTRVVVDKQREIYFIGNVKFHIDTVRDLGTFVEIEAIGCDGSIGRERLKEQCDHYMRVLGIRQEDVIACSYSDMLLERGRGSLSP